MKLVNFIQIIGFLIANDVKNIDQEIIVNENIQDTSVQDRAYEEYFSFLKHIQKNTMLILYFESKCCLANDLERYLSASFQNISPLS